MGKPSLLLCTDLDRTLLPNGPDLESPAARPMFRRLVAREEVACAFVSGRHKELMQCAIRDYDLPSPDYAIGDVGTSLYEIIQGQWQRNEQWEREIAPDWNGRQHDDLADLLFGIEGLRFQEAAKQNRFKLSYYAPRQAALDELLGEVHRRLIRAGVRANLIWSIDDLTDEGLLDVLPKRASKLHAIRFLLRVKGFSERNTVFAGDSGNDLAVLTSGLQSVLVRNAQPQVRRQARQLSDAVGHGATLYIAQGGFMGLNGNYAAGILEGVAHFIPRTRAWMTQSCLPSCSPLISDKT